VSDYEAFVASKARSVDAVGIDAKRLAKHLFPHQRDLVKWALRRGRAAIFADTGLGKTAILLEWARHVSKAGRVLILAPLAVAEQIAREGQRFGVDVACRREDDGSRIIVTNYEMLHRFDASAFHGIVLDESSILKSFNGSTRNALVQAFSATPMRLCCTATPAPNDYTELGNHSEFLGIKSRVEMLAEYFVHDGGSTQDWRIKGHAEDSFWRWVCSWGAVVKRPSDLGHDDGGFALPPLRMHERVVPVDHRDAWAQGLLFAAEAVSLQDQRATRRATMAKRVAIAAELAAGDEPCLIWCELNDEADAVTAAVDGAVQVAGSDSPEDKAARMLGFADGTGARVLTSKASICGFGMNFQRAARMIFLGASHSYEQTYQAVRRCWRFGQTRPVDVFIIRAETEGAIVENFRRKEADAERMAGEMGSRMRDVMRAEVLGATREWNSYEPRKAFAFPEWVRESA
jgi:superfamily II DNA or RNA helicase